MAANNESATAWPLADPLLQQDLLDLVQSAGHYRQLKKGYEDRLTISIHCVDYANMYIFVSEPTRAQKRSTVASPKSSSWLPMSPPSPSSSTYPPSPKTRTRRMYM